MPRQDLEVNLSVRCLSPPPPSFSPVGRGIRIRRRRRIANALLLLLCYFFGLHIRQHEWRHLEDHEPRRRRCWPTFVCQALPLTARRGARDARAQQRTLASSSSQLGAAAKRKGSSGSKNRNRKPSSASTVGIRGFGSAPFAPSTSASSPSSSSGQSSIRIDRSTRAIRFYEYLDRNGAGGPNLQRTALATTADGLRGVVATRDVAKGDDILRIPYEAAVNLGRRGDDPSLPAWQFLLDYCSVVGSSASSAASSSPKAAASDDARRGRHAYYEMLPALGLSPDYLTSTDFFSPEALQALQSPLVVEETLARRERVRRHWESATSREQPPCPPGMPTLEQLQWAVWIVTSRVLTVEGSSPSDQYRLLIPYLDMCNHDRSSPHVLTGRAAPGGMLRVVAGRTVKAGEFVDICYGGGVTGNDRFVQDYGFLDPDPDAYRIVARQLAGETRAGSKFLPQVDRDRALEALGTTALERDEAERMDSADLDVRTAIQYRIGVKKALAELT